MSSQIGIDDSGERKFAPMARGCLDYFPAALAEVARVSMIGNEKHNPGEELHHSRGKSMDHADCIVRHLADRGTFDTVTLRDGREFQVRHTAYAAWRALALLQEELEAAGAPLARAAKRRPEAGPEAGPEAHVVGPWVEWFGGERPVNPCALVEVELRSGKSMTYAADAFAWHHRGFGGDIVRYRVRL